MRRRALLTLLLSPTLPRAATAADDVDRELVDLLLKIVRGWESLEIA
jgi:hypothetical protein